MKKRAILVICILCMLVVAYLAIFGVRRTRIEALKSLVSQNLKIGAYSDEVMSFLDAQHLDHSKLMRPEAMRFGGHSYKDEKVIVAIIRYVDSDAAD